MAPSDSAAVVAQIVATARMRNPSRGVTGALLFTGTHFSQVIEGSRASIDALLMQIRSDPRHTDLQIVDCGNAAARRFPDWSMAYCGQSQFVSRHVTRLLKSTLPVERNRAATWLAELLREFAAP
ncbi:BLUF domain-containing protein [Sphingomonas koreensis]|nr:BLUF domain-containing protein [Sphingomonas koreensis]